MLDSDIVHLGTEALMVAAKLSAPVLIVALIAGVLISLFQAVFQVQDQTLAFVPKLAVGAVVLAMTGNWMLRMLVEYTTALFSSIPSMLA